MRATHRTPSVAARGARPERGVQEAEKAARSVTAVRQINSRILFGDAPDLNIDKALKIAKNRIEWKTLGNRKAANLTMGACRIQKMYFDETSFFCYRQNVVRSLATFR